jgi:ABC-type Na+ efflux pump permease subunit
LILAFAGFIIFISQKLALFNFSSEINMIRELGLSTIVLWGVLTCILFTHQSVFSELENRCAMTVLSKPIRRSEYVLGKYLGLLRALLLGVLLLTLILILTLWIHEGIPGLTRSLNKSSSSFFHTHLNDTQASLAAPVNALGGASLGIAIRSSTSPDTEVWSYFVNRFLVGNVMAMLVGGLLCAFQIAVIASFSLALATFFPTVVVAVGTLSFYIVGHLSDFLVGATRQDGATFYIVRQLIRSLAPNLEQFNPVDHLSRGEAIPAIYVALTFIYGILYVSAVLGATTFAFSRRELP